jgi:hypothetical protein
LPGPSMITAVKPAHRIGAVLSFGPSVYLNREAQYYAERTT